MRKFLWTILIISGCLTAASADTFNFNVLNSGFSGFNAPLPAGTVTVTQNGANAVKFSITMNSFAANTGANTHNYAIQYAISVGGFEFNLANTSNLVLSGVSSTTESGGSLTNVALSTGPHTYDGFGILNGNVGTTNNGNSTANNALTFNFTLTRTSGTLSVSDFQSKLSSNCPSNPCTFVAHITEYDTTGTLTTVTTGFGGTSQISETPEPASLALLGSGMLGVGGLMRKKLRR